MDEPTKETKKNQESENASSGNGEGSEQQNPTLIERANTSAKRMEEATEKQRAENDRTEKLLAIKRMGGMSEGGMHEMTVEDKEKAEAMKFWKGTGIEGAIEKHG